MTFSCLAKRKSPKRKPPRYRALCAYPVLPAWPRRLWNSHDAPKGAHVLKQSSPTSPRPSELLGAIQGPQLRKAAGPLVRLWRPTSNLSQRSIYTLAKGFSCSLLNMWFHPRLIVVSLTHACGGISATNRIAHGWGSRPGYSRPADAGLLSCSAIGKQGSTPTLSTFDSGSKTCPHRRDAVVANRDCYRI